MILRIVAIVAAIAATSLYFISKGKLADKQAELTETQQVLATTQTNLSETRDTLKATETKLKRESATLVKTKSKLDEVNSELFASQQEATKKGRLLSEARTQIGELETNARKLQSELIDTQAELAAASREAEINQLNARIDELEKTNEELAFNLESKTAIADAVTAKKQATGELTLGGINTSISPLTSGEAASRITIETTVNSISTESGLIVLNTSPELRLAPGQTITLVQNMKSVGKVKIQSTTDSYAVANILPGSTGTSKLDSGSTVQLLVL